MQWDRIIPICVYRLSVVVPCCINYVVLYKAVIPIKFTKPFFFKGGLCWPRLFGACLQNVLDPTSP